MTKGTKFTIQYHAGNPNMCRIPELTIRPLPECEGGGWWMPKEQAEMLVRLAEISNGPNEAMAEAFWTARREYDELKANRVLPRPSLPTHLFRKMVEAVWEHPIPDAADRGRSGLTPVDQIIRDICELPQVEVGEKREQVVVSLDDLRIILSRNITEPTPA